MTMQEFVNKLKDMGFFAVEGYDRELKQPILRIQTIDKNGVRAQVGYVGLKQTNLFGIDWKKGDVPEEKAFHLIQTLFQFSRTKLEVREEGSRWKLLFKDEFFPLDEEYYLTDKNGFFLSTKGSEFTLGQINSFNIDIQGNLHSYYIKKAD